MKKLTKKTIEHGQIVTVIESTYTLPTMKNSSWYTPQTKLIGYEDIGQIFTPNIELNVGEKLEIIELTKRVRGVRYKRLEDNKIYSSYLGEFTTFTRLI